jgi:hypothetical protein
MLAASIGGIDLLTVLIVLGIIALILFVFGYRR